MVAPLIRGGLVAARRNAAKGRVAAAKATTQAAKRPVATAAAAGTAVAAGMMVAAHPSPSSTPEPTSQDPYPTAQHPSPTRLHELQAENKAEAGTLTQSSHPSPTNPARSSGGSTPPPIAPDSHGPVNVSGGSPADQASATSQNVATTRSGLSETAQYARWLAQNV